MDYLQINTAMDLWMGSAQLSEERAFEYYHEMRSKK